jgi:hypothetical protein
LGPYRVPYAASRLCSSAAKEFAEFDIVFKVVDTRFSIAEHKSSLRVVTYIVNVAAEIFPLILCTCAEGTKGRQNTHQTSRTFRTTRLQTLRGTTMAEKKSLEISISESAGVSDATGVASEKAKDAFEALGSLLSEAVEPFRKQLTETVATADEVELKLDLALKGGGKWVVVSMEAAATVSVKLVWKRK